MSLLGNDVRNLAMFDEAVNLHTQALGGLTKDGSQPLHDREVLEVMENLATARLDRHLYGEWQAGELELANKMQMEVVKHREWRLGKEHRQTLGSYCNLALIKAALGATEDAELMIRTRLPIAERNLGKTHISTLHGKASLGHVLMRAGKLSEAEAVLDDVVREHERTRRDHPNQLMAAAFLMECYVRQGKLAEAAPLQEKVMKGVKRIFGDGSPWEDVLNAKAGLQYIDRT
ncbi:MAG: hypothetical protein M1820_010655 [Bogoriella megaspora]|nr:MAG: hypothetical protein M1820_010655 [Bogoriella megaspora]